MNSEVGFVRRVLSILEYEGISFSIEGGNSLGWKKSYKNNNGEYFYYPEPGNEDIMIQPVVNENYFMGNPEYADATPSAIIYYGDEAGVQGIGDPYNRSCYPWGKENQTLIDWYSTLGILRQNPIFIDGETNILHAENGVFVYERRKGDKRIVIAINKSNEPFELKLTEPHTDYLNIKRLTQVTLNSEDVVVLIK